MLNFQILGPLQVRAGAEQLALGPLRRQALLGVLLCRANQVVPSSVLAEALWDGPAPRTGRKCLQMQVSVLRQLLKDPGATTAPAASAGPRLVHAPPGYALRVEAGQVDALRFAELARAGRRALRSGQVAVAGELLGQAAGLWRGPVLADLATVSTIAAEAESLREQYLSAWEDLAEARLAVGRHAELTQELDVLTRQHPFRERLVYALMLALYRSGRQAEALARYDEARQVLARELGIRPSPVLSRLYESILVGDQAIDALTTGVAPVTVRAVATGRTSLARDIPDFTGRAREVNEVMTLLGDAEPGAVIALSGPVGVGKTVLAVHCAHRLGRVYPHGRVLATLREPDGRPRPTSAVLADLLRGLGVPVSPGAGPDELAALLRDTTAGRRMLFILDDATGEAQSREALAALGSGDGTSVIVTARRHLGGLEAAWPLAVDPLPEDEARALLARLVGAGRLVAESEATARLVAACGGLPLLIRAVGSRLRALRHLALAQFADRLADTGQALSQLETGEARLQARLRCALRDLAPADQEALRGLARLAGGPFTARQAADGLGIRPRDAESAIERLLEARVVAISADEVEAHADDSLRYLLPWPLQALAREEQPF
jgi:DNA-binding SARP family transcriptional activator/transcriptional regulator with XRE-family HTH domain